MDSKKPNYNKENLIYHLYDKVQAYGYYVRKNKLDGLQSWNIIKDSFNLKNFEKTTISWANQVFHMYEFLTNKRNGFGINDIERSESDDEQLWQIHHFFLQHVRIPYKNKQGNLLRLMQIAYNSGQMIASKDEYDNYGLHKYISYYYNNDMANIDTYVKWNNVNELSISNDEIKLIVSEIDNIINKKSQAQL